MNILQLSAKLASLVPAMAQDSVVNNEILIRGMLEQAYNPEGSLAKKLESKPVQTVEQQIWISAYRASILNDRNNVMAVKDANAAVAGFAKTFPR